MRNAFVVALLLGAMLAVAVVPASDAAPAAPPSSGPSGGSGGGSTAPATPLPPAPAGSVVVGDDRARFLMSNDLSCQIITTGGTMVYPDAAAPADCGFFIYTAGNLYGPDLSKHASSHAPPPPATLHPWHGVAQSAKQAAGTDVDPWEIDTVASADIVDLDVHTEFWMVDEGHYKAHFTVSRQDTPPTMALDCSFAALASGTSTYGVMPSDKTIGCTRGASSLTPPYILTSGDGAFVDSDDLAKVGIYEGDIGKMWSDLRNTGAYTGSCQCGAEVDSGIGLSWFVADPDNDGDVTLVEHTLELDCGQCPPITTDFLATTANCADRSITFTPVKGWGHAPIVSWNWAYGDGKTSTQEFPPAHAYAKNQPYTATLTVRDTYGFEAKASRVVEGISSLACCPASSFVRTMVAREGEVVLVNITMKVPDDAPYTVKAIDLPKGATFDPATLQFIWTSTGEPIVALFKATSGDCSRMFGLQITPPGSHVPTYTDPEPPRDPIDDSDHDGVADSADDCPGVPDHAQADADDDGTGDACQDDLCAGATQCSAPASTGPSGARHATDTDHDGVADASDDCKWVADPLQGNMDHDAQGDVCDEDSDGDGMPNTATDGAMLDNCPLVSNPDQRDADGDGVGDACAGSPGAPAAVVPRLQSGVSHAPAKQAPATTVLAAALLLVAAVFVARRR